MLPCAQVGDHGLESSSDALYLLFWLLRPKPGWSAVFSYFLSWPVSALSWVKGGRVERAYKPLQTLRKYAEDIGVSALG